MNSEIWKKKLTPFIIPFLQKAGKEPVVFTPCKGMPVKLVFEGTFYIEGRHADMILNFSDPDILLITIQSQHRAIRVAWDKLVAFELSTQTLWK